MKKTQQKQALAPYMRRSDREQREQVDLRAQRGWRSTDTPGRGRKTQVKHIKVIKGGKHKSKQDTRRNKIFKIKQGNQQINTSNRSSHWKTNHLRD